MNGRERLERLVHKQPADGLAWTTIVDTNTLDHLPGAMQGMSGLDFHRHLDCDVFLLNPWGLSLTFQSPTLEWPSGVEEHVVRENRHEWRELSTPSGTLRSERERGHPTRFPVTTIDDVGLYRSVWEGARFVERDDAAAYKRTIDLIGDQGIVTRFWGPSTIPRLLEVDMGTMAFYYQMNDHPDEMDALVRTIHEKELRAFELLASGPCDVAVLCENTSTYYISPDIYRRYNGRHVKDFCDIVHAAGKTAIIHMCGHVKNILKDIRQTGLDGVHALTPPPTGDTPFDLALDVLGEDAVIIGVLDPTVFIAGPLDEVGPALDALYTLRLRKANFCLCPASDGLTVPLERFEAVASWMRKHGGRS